MRFCTAAVRCLSYAGRWSDFRTIADFRNGNVKAIRGVCREFIAVCRRLDLFSQAIVAIDGSKFKAVNQHDRNLAPAKMKRRLEQLDQGNARYLGELERADRKTRTLQPPDYLYAPTRSISSAVNRSPFT